MPTKFWQRNEMIIDTATIYLHNTVASVKDEALDVCIASGDDDVFIDMDTVGDRIESKNTDANKELRRIIELANQKDAQYIHLY
jgi:hypothetical protein